LQGIEGYVAFKRCRKHLVALAEPICAPEDVSALLKGFKDFGSHEGRVVAFFGATDRHLPAFEAEGYEIYKAAEDSVVILSEFTLQGNKMENVRGGYNRARNAGLEMMEYHPAKCRDEELEAECSMISREWLREKKKPELEFVLGQLDWDVPGDRRFFIAKKNERMEGFLTYHPIYRSGWYLDLSRRRMEAPNGTMDFLIAESMIKFQEEGENAVYLGLSLYMGFARELENASRLTKLAMRLGTPHFHRLYPVESQRFFKEKYGPRWEELYLCTSDRFTLSLFRDVLDAFQPKGVMRFIRRGK